MTSNRGYGVSGRHKKSRDHKMDLSVITVNWRSADYLKKCLAALYGNTRGIRLEVIVIDNASRDGSRQMVAEHYPQVTFMESQLNLGFAGANNLAFQLSSAPFVLFLNPDTEVLGPAVAALLAFLQKTPDAGIVGPRLLNTDGSAQVTSIMQFPSLLNEALNFEYLHRAFPKFPLWNIAPLFEPPTDRGVAVQAISGACMMMPRSVFEQVNMFDTSYFMFSEDLDLCYKVRKAGRRIYYLGGATVVHHGGRSTATAPDGFRTVMIQASHARFIRSRYGRLHGFLYRQGMAIVATIRLVAGCAFLIATLGLVGRRRLRFTLSKWRMVFRWAISAAGTEYGFLPAAPERQGLSRPSKRHCEHAIVSFPSNPAGPRTHSQGRKLDPEAEA